MYENDPTTVFMMWRSSETASPEATINEADYMIEKLSQLYLNDSTTVIMTWESSETMWKL